MYIAILQINSQNYLFKIYMFKNIYKNLNLFIFLFLFRQSLDLF